MAFDPDAPAPPGSALFGLDTPPKEAAVWVLPVPFDATTSFRRGAALGPEAVIAASHQVDLFDLRFGTPWKDGIHTAPLPSEVLEWNREASAAAAPVIAKGGARPGDERCAVVDAAGERVNEFVAAWTERALEAGALPVILGGDHSVPYGAITTCARRFSGMGILHFDAHADLRDSFEGFRWSHASILYNVLAAPVEIVRVVSVGVRDLGQGERKRLAEDERLRVLFDPDWARIKLAGDDRRLLIREYLDLLPEKVYLSFDVDGLDPSLCPHTGTPVPGGFDWHETMLWLEELVASRRRIVGMDLCEVSPGPEGDAQGQGWDAIVGSRLLYRMIGAARALEAKLRSRSRAR